MWMWFQKNLLTLLFTLLILIFLSARVKTIFEKKFSSNTLLSHTKTTKDELPHYHHLLPDSKAPSHSSPCLGADCDKKATMTSVKKIEDIENSFSSPPDTSKDSFRLEKEQACDNKSFEDCTDLAEASEDKGDIKGAIKFLQKACDTPGPDIEACMDIGKLLTRDQADQAIRDCRSGQLKTCITVSGYYHKNGDRLQAREWSQYGCDHGLSEACVHVGYMLAPSEIKNNQERCDKGNLESCLYLVGQGSLNDNAKMKLEYFNKGCDLGNELSCLAVGESLAATNLDDLVKTCFDGNDKKSCLLATGLTSTDAIRTANSSMHKKLAQKACELGAKIACTGK